MTVPVNLADQYFSACSDLVASLENIRTLNDRIAQDSSFITNYFNQNPHRTDIDATAFNAGIAATVQLLFTFDSGSPAQKAAIFKLLV